MEFSDKFQSAPENQRLKPLAIAKSVNVDFLHRRGAFITEHASSLR